MLLGRLAAVVELGRAAAYAARTFGAPAGVRGLAVECAWLAAHVAVYPAGSCASN